MVTLDLPLQALRRRDPKNGLAVPPRLTWRERRAISCAGRVGCSDVVRSKRRTFGNLATFFPDEGHGGAVRMDGQPARLS